MRRRQFLRHTAAVFGSSALPGMAESPGPPLCSFFVVSDTHFLAQKTQPDLPGETSARYCGALVDTLNRLPGSPLPEAAGGGVVGIPQGVLHTGDIVDSADKQGEVFEAMQRTEWAQYLKEFGLNGNGGRLHFPVMEIGGNHDGPQGTGYVATQLAARQRSRQGLSGISDNGLHYSWDWNGVHFIALGLIVGTEKKVNRPRRYAAMDSLDFLRRDLAAHPDPGQAVVLMHHVDFLRYAVEKPEAKYETWEWDPADVQAFHAALKGRRTVQFFGHTHGRNVFRWDGGALPSPTGRPAFNVDNSAHPGSPEQAFFYAEIRPGGILVRERFTRDGWQSSDWTPAVWNMDF